MASMKKNPLYQAAESDTTFQQITTGSDDDDEGSVDSDLETSEPFAGQSTEEPLPRQRAHTTPALFSGSKRMITTPFMQPASKDAGTTESSATYHESYQQHQEELTLREQTKERTIKASRSQAEKAKRLSSSLEDLRMLEASSQSTTSTLSKKKKHLPSASGRSTADLSKSTISLRSSTESVKNFFGTLRRKMTRDSTPTHVCKPMVEGMSKCRCGRSW
eukprot:m.582469 g.582469  ORF g.582469 m.582469 type:complete len:219 (+) comp57943_c0_seq10:1292-1948(+)